MKKLVLVFTVLFFIVSQSAFTDNQGAINNLLALLVQAGELLQDEYGISDIYVDPDNIGTVEYVSEGSQMEISRTFFSGQAYVIIASGDEDAIDINIQVFDENDNLIAEDLEPAKDAVAIISPKWTGPCTIHVILKKASAAKGAAYAGFGVAYFAFN